MVSLGLLVLRVAIGAINMIHGYTKVFGGAGKSATVSPEAERLLGAGFKQQLDQGGAQNVAGFMQMLGVPYPKPAAYALMAAELGGGLALILGWRTRLVALVLTVVQAVAIQKVHAPNGLINQGGYEFNATLAATTAALVLTGPGKIAAD